MGKINSLNRQNEQYWILILKNEQGDADDWQIY